MPRWGAGDGDLPRATGEWRSWPTTMELQTARGVLQPASGRAGTGKRRSWNRPCGSCIRRAAEVQPQVVELDPAILFCWNRLVTGQSCDGDGTCDLQRRSCIRARRTCNRRFWKLQAVQVDDGDEPEGGDLARTAWWTTADDDGHRFCWEDAAPARTRPVHEDQI